MFIFYLTKRHLNLAPTAEDAWCVSPGPGETNTDLIHGDLYSWLVAHYTPVVSTLYITAYASLPPASRKPSGYSQGFASLIVRINFPNWTHWGRTGNSAMCCSISIPHHKEKGSSMRIVATLKPAMEVQWDGNHFPKSGPIKCFFHSSLFVWDAQWLSIQMNFGCNQICKHWWGAGNRWRPQHYHTEQQGRRTYIPVVAAFMVPSPNTQLLYSNSSTVLISIFKLQQKCWKTSGFILSNHKA